MYDSPNARRALAAFGFRTGRFFLGISFPPPPPVYRPQNLTRTSRMCRTFADYPLLYSSWPCKLMAVFSRGLRSYHIVMYVAYTSTYERGRGTSRDEGYGKKERRKGEDEGGMKKPEKKKKTTKLGKKKTHTPTHKHGETRCLLFRGSRPSNKL